MLYKAKDSKIKADKAVKNNNFADALMHYREMRGYAQNFLSSNPVANTIADGHTYHAEASFGIAHCLLELGRIDAENENQQAYIETLRKAQEELEEAKQAIALIESNVAHAFPRYKEGLQKTLADLKGIHAHYQQLINKGYMIINWNTAISSLTALDQRMDELAELAPQDVDGKQLDQEIQKAVEILGRALYFAEQAGSQADVNDIRETLVELYEESGDLLSHFEQNNQFSEFRLQLLKIILRQYGEAFNQMIKDPAIPAENKKKMYINVLNSLETQASLIARLAKVSAKIEYACIETIRFVKKFPPEDFGDALTALDKLEIQAYVFGAQRLLSIHKKDHKKEHKAQAIVEAKKCHALAKAVIPLDSSLPIAQGVIDIQYYVCKRILKELFNELCEHPSFDQNVIALFNVALGIVHRNGNQASLDRIFTPESNTQRSGSLTLSMGLLKSAFVFVNHPNLEELTKANIEHLWTAHAGHFKSMQRQNPHQHDQTLHKHKPLTPNGYKDTLRQHVKDYLTEIEVFFSKKQIILAMPMLLEEFRRIAKTNISKQQDWIKIIEKHMQEHTPLLKEFRIQLIVMEPETDLEPTGTRQPAAAEEDVLAPPVRAIVIDRNLKRSRDETDSATPERAVPDDLPQPSPLKKPRAEKSKV